MAQLIPMFTERPTGPGYYLATHRCGDQVLVKLEKTRDDRLYYWGLDGWSDGTEYTAWSERIETRPAQEPAPSRTVEMMRAIMALDSRIRSCGTEPFGPDRMRVIVRVADWENSLALAALLDAHRSEWCPADCNVVIDIEPDLGPSMIEG